MSETLNLPQASDARTERERRADAVPESPARGRSGRLRVLIVDFDFYSTVGGGQTFYRRLVERHPDWDFYYPSRGADMKEAGRGRLPPNLHPFGFDPQLQLWDVVDAASPSWSTERWYGVVLATIAVAVQGRAFDVVEVPAFFPAAHLVRPIFSAFGILVRRVSLGLHGWGSTAIRNSYEDEASAEVVRLLEELEQRNAAAVDVRYTVSDLHAADNARIRLPVRVVGMHDALEEVPVPDLRPPGSGPPDLWFVARLDRNKGPDVFIDIVSRVPSRWYGKCYMVGPDNMGSGYRQWSQVALELAAEKGVEAEYLGELDAEEVRRQVYQGRAVVVIPSRTDAFNYVAVEALTQGCPILLSVNAGAAGFLRERHADILPPLIDPEDVEDASAKLWAMLKDYEKVARRLRKRLNDNPWPRPQRDFMAPIWGGPVVSDPSVTQPLVAAVAALRPLFRKDVEGWRLVARPPAEEPVTLVVRASAGKDALAATLASVVAIHERSFPIIVVDDGSDDPRGLLEVVESIAPDATILRQGRQGRAAAFNRGLRHAATEYVCLLEAGDGVDPERLALMAARLEASPEAVGVHGAWSEVDAGGRSVREHAAAPFDRMAAAVGEAALPGVGALVRRAAAAQAGGFDVSLGELAEVDFWLRLSRQGDVQDIPDHVGWRTVAAETPVAVREELPSYGHLMRKLLASPEEAVLLREALAARRAVAPPGPLPGSQGLQP